MVAKIASTLIKGTAKAIEISDNAMVVGSVGAGIFGLGLTFKEQISNLFQPLPVRAAHTEKKLGIMQVELSTQQTIATIKEGIRKQRYVERLNRMKEEAEAKMGWIEKTLSKVFAKAA